LAVNYLVLRNGVQDGPYTWPQLQEQLGQGAVAWADQVRREDSDEWITLEALARGLEPTAPPTGAPGDPSLTATYAYSLPGPEVSCRLYDPGAVALATLFGSPIAGTILMAINYKRLGQGSSAVGAVASGVVGTALAIWIASLLPQGIGSGMAFGLLFITMNAAKTFQGKAIEDHKRRGGKLASLWGAFFIGLGVAAVIVLAVIAIVMVLMLKLDGPGS
jgi:hypothetical protein